MLTAVLHFGAILVDIKRVGLLTEIQWKKMRNGQRDCLFCGYLDSWSTFLILVYGDTNEWNQTITMCISMFLHVIILPSLSLSQCLSHSLNVSLTLSMALIYQTSVRQKTCLKWTYTHFNVELGIYQFERERRLRWNLTSGLSLCTQVFLAQHTGISLMNSAAQVAACCTSVLITK